MKRSSIALAAALAVAAAAAPGPVAAGGPAASPSAFALPVEPGGGTAPWSSFAGTALEGPGSSAGGALAWTAGDRLEAVRYRPRRRPPPVHRRPSRSAGGYSQIHGGFFDPDGDPSRSILLGFRGGTEISDQAQVGIGLDWSHRSDRRTAVVREVPIPGGGTAERRLELARSSSDLIPVTAFLQLVPGIDGPVRPYFGIAGGYELLFVSADDFETGEEFDATFGGWGWQAWGGIAFPLSGRSRINAEVFVNSAEVERDVDEPEGTFREIVNMDGVGARFGLSWGF